MRETGGLTPETTGNGHLGEKAQPPKNLQLPSMSDLGVSVVDKD